MGSEGASEAWSGGRGARAGERGKRRDGEREAEVTGALDRGGVGGVEAVGRGAERPREIGRAHV